MKQISFLYLSFFTIVVIFFVHVMATINYWYWLIGGLDLVMHLLGGLFIGSSTLYIYYQSRYIEPKHFSSLFVFFLVLTATAFVGVLWEFFEFIIDQYVTAVSYLSFSGGVQDTLSDLLADLIGSIIAGLIFIATWKRNS